MQALFFVIKPIKCKQLLSKIHKIARKYYRIKLVATFGSFFGRL